MVKNPLANAEDARDVGSIPGSGKSPGVGNGNALPLLPGKSRLVLSATEATACSLWLLSRQSV